MLLRPLKVINKAFLNVKRIRAEIGRFKLELLSMLGNINEKESEEHHKNLFSDFFKNTYYASRHAINTKGRNDLEIHTVNKPSSTVGVIMEVKKLKISHDMYALDKINTKALRDLALFFMREQIILINDEIKNLNVTNINEWFIFDAQIFETAFGKDKYFVKKFEEFEKGSFSATNTDHFHKNIAAHQIDKNLN